MESDQEQVSILIRMENLLMLISTGQDVIKGPFVFDTPSSTHEALRNKSAEICQADSQFNR